jgi:ankyrin repeat protein
MDEDYYLHRYILYLIDIKYIETAIENIKKMSDIDYHPNDSICVFLYSIRAHYTDAIRYLLPLSKYRKYILCELFRSCVFNGNCKKILDLLLKNIDYTIHINEKYSNNTPLHYAVIKNRKDCILMLLEHGADPSILNNDNKTPLDIANEDNYIEIAQLIEDHIKIQEQINNSAKSARLKK